MTNGKVRAYEAHREEEVGQLDYVSTQEKEDGSCLADGAEKDLYCLEIGKSTMLLLEKVVGEEAEDFTFRRSGISRGYRLNFFDRAKVEELWLV